MTRGRVAVHAHFYQPLRADPFSGVIPADPTATPYHDWNARIDAESYKPNAARGNLERISWDLGPTLAGWLAAEDPSTHLRFVEAAPGRAMAQPYHHSILPLASAADRRTEIRWGIRDSELRFGFRPNGVWLPETAVDLPTLALLAEEGIAYTILAPWQAADAQIDTRRPYRVSIGSGQAISVAFYDAALSSAVSFEPTATDDADRFALERIAPRLARPPFPDGTTPTANSGRFSIALKPRAARTASATEILRRLAPRLSAVRVRKVCRSRLKLVRTISSSRPKKFQMAQRSSNALLRFARNLLIHI